MTLSIIQINLQRQFGGGEIYTAFLCRALSRLGVQTRLVVHPEAEFWPRLGLPLDTYLETARDWDACASLLPAERSWVLIHGRMPSHMALGFADRHVLTAIAHMPPQGRPSDRYEGFQRVFGVSGYVLSGLRAMGVPIWDEPLYGVAHLTRTEDAKEIRKNSRFDWDRRKGRDRVMGWLEPLVSPLFPRPVYTRREGITLAIVSRLTPIKQFPLLFQYLTPWLQRNPCFNLEIFGSGGYASVRDLVGALRPLGSRVRWWGHQRDVSSVYRQIDYLMTGLPEKEALGLNVIEAQSAGVPVLAVDAPPFDETVVPELTGLRYRDPRQDDGADFGKVLERLRVAPLRIDPTAAAYHLERFSEAAFDARMRRLVDFMQHTYSL